MQLKSCPFRVIGTHKFNPATKMYDYEESFAPCMGCRCPAFQLGGEICIRSNGGPMYMEREEQEGF